MLFSGKENNFKYLVIFQKILWKIFYGVWLYGWKCYFPTTTKIKITQKTHFLTFSHLPNKYIISSLNSETQIKPRKKKNHNLVKLREEGREGGRSVLGCDNRDRGRRIGAATAIAIGAKVKLNGEVEGWSRTATSNGEVEVEQLCALGLISFWVWSLWPELGWPEGCALSLSLLPLSHSHLALSLSVFRKIVFEGKIKTEINLHQKHGQLKTISGKCIFHVQPNTHKYGKAFSEVIFTQNKHSQSFTSW